MSKITNYIVANALPCKVWLRAKAPNFTLDGSLFTWNNSFGSTNYNFIQSNPTYHPVVTVDGVSFSNEDRLYPANTDLFTGIDSYSLIFISSGALSSKNTLLNISKTSLTKPTWLEEYYDSTRINQQFSLVNVGNTLAFNYSSQTIQTLASSHDIRYGVTRTKVNSNVFSVLVNSDKGNVINNYPSNFYLGNSGDNSNPFTGNLKDFLVFIPAITNDQLENLIEYLLEDNLVWDDIEVTDWESITEPDWGEIE